MNSVPFKTIKARGTIKFNDKKKRNYNKLTLNYSQYSALNMSWRKAMSNQ